MKDIKDKFDSIICLCAEGEFMTRTKLAELVIKEAQAGMKLCDITATRLERQRIAQLNYK